jgi:hypothetical protein
VRASFLERKLAAFDRVAHRARNQDLAGLRVRDDPRGDVDGDAAQRAPLPLDLPHVDPGALVEPQLARYFAEGRCALDCTGRAPERRDEPVARPILFGSAVSPQNATGPHDELVEERLPASVAQIGGARGRADDVGEEDGGETASRSHEVHPERRNLL